MNNYTYLRCIGLILCLEKWKIKSTSNFNFKTKIKGKIGIIVLKIKVYQDLKIYKVMIINL